MWTKPALAKAIRLAHTRLGLRVRRLREAMGLSQEDLAERTGLHAKYVSRVENGAANPSLAVLVAIAEALNTRTANLLTAPKLVRPGTATR